MSTTAELLALGWRFHQAGDLPRAEQAYRQLLQQEPGNAQAWYLLGALRQARGDLAAAARCLEQAARWRPGFVEAIQHRGIVYALQGRMAEAAVQFREALRIQPDSAEAYYNLGSALAAQQHRDEAVRCYQQAVRLRPDYAEAYNNLAALFREQQQPVEAEASCRAALRVRPQMAEAHSSLGGALLDQKRVAEAEASYRTAVRLRPEFAEAHYNLGVVLLQQRRLAEAEASFSAAVRLRPQMAGAHSNLGLAVLDQQRPEEAVSCFQRALQLNPGFAEAHNNLAMAYWQLGRFDEALASFATAIQFKPDYAEPHWSGGLIRLLRGEFERGWTEYEWRWRQKDSASCLQREFAQPRWDGSPPAGRTILLHAEQGLGDTIQFVRYARLLRDQGARVILECQRPLLHVLGRCPEIDHLVAQGDPLPPHDVHAPLLSLPYYFKTTLATVPAEVPYLESEPALVEQWRRELAALPGFKIGINWQGNAKYQQDRQRSIALREFAPLAAVPGVQLVSLQKGPGTEQLAAVAGPWRVIDLSARLDEKAGAFMDTAAVMKNLDLVVTSDTSIPHLAGALGVPVWVALAKVPDWRFLLEREDSPWYPTMRLFRQEARGDWGPVFQRISDAVKQHLNP